MSSRLARAGALVVALLALLALGAVPASAYRAHEPRDLDILVTNDDGWRGPGGADTPLIVALRDALAAEGHHVTVVAPATDQSGNGTRFTIGPLTVTNPGPDVWTVDGAPSDSVLVGATALLPEKPDLVVSGINPGGNFSSLLNHSGTVGAATTALELGIPAIAASIDGTPDQSLAAKDAAAAYIADLVDRLARRDGPLLEPGLGLNVNYPGATPPTGTVRTKQDLNSYITFAYTNSTGETGQPGVYVPAITPSTATPEPGSDWAALRDGKVSIQPIDADRTADPFGFGRLGGLFGDH